MRSGPFVLPALPVVAALLLGGPSSPLGAEPPAAPPPAAQAPADKPAIPDASAYESPDPYPVPPGTPADQALWRKATDDSNRLSVSRGVAARLQWKAHNGKNDARLADRAKGSSGGEAARLESLARRVQDAWIGNRELTSAQWPVDPTRGCQYPAQQLESAMRLSDGPEKSAMLTQARRDVTRCTETMDTVLGRMVPSNQEFEKALAEADAALAPAAASAPAAAPAVAPASR
jgi:hypothetical protein